MDKQLYYVISAYSFSALVIFLFVVNSFISNRRVKKQIKLAEKKFINKEKWILLRSKEREEFFI